MRRLHELDALRAFAMLLGIAWHAAYLFQDAAPEGSVGSVALAWFTSTSHAFRMPLFFFIAGFFAALVIESRGEGGFLRNRAKRIGLPLAVGALTIVPATLAASAWASRASFELVWTPVHLWFLEFLLLYYAAGFILRRIDRLSQVASHLRELMLRPVARLPLGAALAAAAVAMGGAGARTDTDFVPNVGELAYYGVFFGIGWLLWACRSEVSRLAVHGWAFLGLALALSVPYVALEERAAEDWLQGASSFSGVQLAYFVCGAVLAWSAIFGLLRAAQLLFVEERPLVRYLVDASYWMYLIHLPVVYLCVGLLSERMSLPWVPALIVTVIATGVVSLATYHAFVRFTVIGNVLHGPRKRPESLGSPARPEYAR